MPASDRSRGWWMSPLGWAAVLATTVAVVVTFVPGGTDPYFGPKVGVLVIGASVALGCHVGALVAGRDHVVVPRVAVAAGMYLVVMVIATVVSVSPISSLIGSGDRHGGVVELVALLALAWLVIVHTWRVPERLGQLVGALVAATGLHAVYILLVRVGIDVPWPGAAPYTIPVGTMGNSNFAGAQLVLSVPLVLFLRWRATDPRAQRWWLGAIGVVLVALFLTDARGAAIALFPAVAVAGLVAPTLLPRRVVRAAVVLSILALVAVIAAAGGFSRGSGSPGSKLLNNETLTGRFVYWKGTLGLLEDHPVLGTGPATFGLTFPRYSPREMTGRPVPVDEPHNILLERATDAGIFGLASYLFVLGLTFVAVRRVRRQLTGARLALLGAWSGALVAYVVQGLTSIDAVPLALDGWLSLAALAALADPWVRHARTALTDAAEDTSTSPARAVPRALLVLAGAFVAMAVVVALIPWVGDVRLRSGLDLQADVRAGRVSSLAMTAQLDRAIATNPVDPALRIQAAAAAADLLDAAALSDDERTALAQFAATRSDQALTEVPDDIAARRASATAHGVLAGGDGAALAATEQRWRELEALDPFDSTIRLGHAHFLLDWNDRTAGNAASPAALAAARRAAARALVDDANELTDDSSWLTWYLVARAYERLGARDDAIAAARHSLRIERARPGPKDLITRLGATP